MGLGRTGGPAIANLLHPGADRLIFFHVVASGRCWVSLADGERHWASAGDVIVLPYGDQFTMGGAEPTEPVPITSVLAPPPWERVPIIRHGQGGSRTDVVCGFLHSDDVLFDPALRALPPVFVVRPPEGPAARWVEANISFALEQAGERGLPSTRLPELLLVEILRLHLSTALSARQPLPATARHLANPLPHGLADAHRPGAARYDRVDGRRGRTTRRVRLGGGVQPRVQALPRLRAKRLARLPPQQLILQRGAVPSRFWVVLPAVLPNWNAQDNTGRHEPHAQGPVAWTR
jgi:Cupin